MDPATCCLLGICCPPEAQLNSLVALFRTHGNLDDEAANHAAQQAMAALESADLAPLLAALKKSHHEKKDKS